MHVFPSGHHETQWWAEVVWEGFLQEVSLRWACCWHPRAWSPGSRENGGRDTSALRKARKS